MEKAKALVRSIILSSSFRHSSITVSGTLINALLGAVFYIILARTVGPADFGLFMLAVTTITLIVDVADLGTDTGLVNFVSRHRKTNRPLAYKLLKLGFYAKVVVGTFVSLLLFLYAQAISIAVFDKPELELVLKVASIGILGQLVYSYIIQFFQSYERFVSWSLFQIISNALRLILLILLSYVFVSVVPAMWLYVLIPILFFLIGLMYIPKGVWKEKNVLEVGKTFFSYNAWVAVFSAFAALSARLDTFLTGRYLDAHSLGFYTAAVQLVSFLPQIVGAIGTALAPKIAQQDTLPKFISYLKKSQLMVLGIALLFIVFSPLASILIPLFYGVAYVPMVPVFYILFIAMLLFLISVPIHQAVFHYYEYPRLFVYLSIVNVLMVFFGGICLIPPLGIMGAAYSVLSVNVINFLVPLIWVLWKIKRELLDS